MSTCSSKTYYIIAYQDKADYYLTNKYILVVMCEPSTVFYSANSMNYDAAGFQIIYFVIAQHILVSLLLHHWTTFFVNMLQ